jgi:hypothetical protein
MEENKEQKVEETKKDNVTKVDLKKVAEDNVIKVDLSKPSTPKEEKNEVKEDNANDGGVVAESKDAEPTQEQEKVQPEAEAQEAPVLEEIKEEAKEETVEEAVVEETVQENVEEEKQELQKLPENIEKLVEFIEETGGDINDYVKLNQDYSKLNDRNLLYEYYRQTKPHLDNEEINFLMEDSFSYNEEKMMELKVW